MKIHIYSGALVGVCALLVALSIWFLRQELRAKRPQIERESFYTVVRPAPLKK